MDNQFSPFNTPSPDSTGETVPAYILAADNHNIGNSLGGSWFDPDTWQTKFDNAGKFIATSVLSGADSLYNSAMTVGSWAGLGDGGHDTADFISGLDDDLGAYYRENRQAVDLAGFVITSFAPGLGGIKLLNAGQTALKGARAGGILGANLSKATGLLVPEIEASIKLSAKKIVQSQGAVTALNRNTINALAAGFGQQALEAAAFETAVQATMFKSPVLEGQDGYDIAKNIAFGGLVGGVIGGAFEGAKVFGGIKKYVAAETKTGANYSSLKQAAEVTPAGQKAILIAEDIQNTPVPGSIVTPDMPLGDMTNVYEKLVANKIERGNNAIRTNINSLGIQADNTVTNMVADAFHITKDSPVGASEFMNAFLHAEEISTIGKVGKLEAVVNKAVKSLDIGDEAAAIQTRYVKLVGEDAGAVLTGEAPLAHIADLVKVGKNSTMESAVLDEARSYKFNVKNTWNPTELKGATAHLDSEARQIWATKLLKEVPKDIIVHEYDIPLLQRIYKDQQAGIKTPYYLKYADDSVGTGPVGEDLFNQLKDSKVRLADRLQADMITEHPNAVPVKNGNEAIARITDVKQSFLEGTKGKNELDDLFAKDYADKVYTQGLVSKGLRSDADGLLDTSVLPKYAKVSYNTKALESLDGTVIDGMTWIKQQQKLYQENADRIFASNAGVDINSSALSITDSDLLNANLTDGGSGLATFANGGYGSLGSKMQHIGANITRPLKQAFRDRANERLASAFVKLGSDQAVAIEFQSISNKIASTMEQYVIDDLGVTGANRALVSKKIYEYRQALADGVEGAPIPQLQKGAPEFIEIKSEDTYNAIKAHIDTSAEHVRIRKETNAAQGQVDNKQLDVFRPVPPNTNDYPFFAFVKDNKVTGAGHTTMIHAATEKELRELVSKVPTDKGYKVIYKDQAEEFYKAKGEYDYARTLNENYIDSDLKSRGINSQFFTQTDPQKIANDIIQYHNRQADVTAVELVRLKYQPAFDWLEDQGKQLTQVGSSQYGSKLSQVEKFGKNPYTDYIKTALDVSKASEFPLLYNANKALDKAVSRVYDSISSVWNTAKSPAELDSINQLLKDNGINNAYYDSATELLANHSASKGVLSKFIRTSNAIMSKFTLALDPLNGLNNAIGANILRSTELKQLTDGIKAGNADLAGQLSQLAKIKVPGVEAQEVLAPTKLMSKAVQNFFSDDGTLLNRYKADGYIKDSLQQFKSMIDDFTLQGTETAAQLDTRLSTAFQKAKSIGIDLTDKGEKVTGNKFFEEFNRFISADVMRQITDLGVGAKLMEPAEAKAYINTFVNRVEGNTVASQRPVMFQGPIGQAVGLFQSYQFNLMQQLFRYVGEGTGKDAAMLLGLQGTLYGINGLPGFNAINTHVVGNLSGNKNHTDLYDATYGIFGKTAGDFLMYGAPSSIIQTNLYSRGDINPRSLTIIPSTFKDIPIVSGYSKLLGSLFETTQKIQGGGNVWESILQGLEHNGISRPLAGLAQTLQATTGNGQVYSTTNKGTILGSNDLLSFATLSRLAGGRPLDEAIINDGVYRIQAYEAQQHAAKLKLYEAVKTTGIQGQQADADTMAKFAEQYAATGGKQSQFNKFIMSQYVAANAPAAEKIRQQLSSPFSQKMQILMGGRNPTVEAGVGEVPSTEE